MSSEEVKAKLRQGFLRSELIWKREGVQVWIDTFVISPDEDYVRHVYVITPGGPVGRLSFIDADELLGMR